MFTILLFAAIAQQPPNSDDLFDEVVENWIADSLPGERPAGKFDERTMRLIDMLGCEHYGCRSFAQGELQSMGRSVLRPLVWGTRHRDLNVAHYCKIMLEKLYVCQNCGGRGSYDNGYVYDINPHPCSLCRGTGLHKE